MTWTNAKISLVWAGLLIIIGTSVLLEIKYKFNKIEIKPPVSFYSGLTQVDSKV